ncbi:MAG: MlaD family protein [Planctomycetota bacterium]|nr:MlaD family protein [Planctomycetota bacterium]
MDFTRRDILTGLFVLIAIGVLMAGLYMAGGAATGVAGKEFYTVRFKNLGLLQERTPVAFAGTAVGQITEIRRLAAVTEDGFVAEAKIAIDRDVVLREGSKAMIRTDGFIGEKYLDLTPGDPKGAVLPAGASLTGELAGVSGVMNQATDLIAEVRIALAKIQEISTGVGGAIDEAKDLLGALDEIAETNRDDIRSTIAGATKLVATLQRLIDENRQGISSTIGGLEQRLEEAGPLMATMSETLDETRKGLNNVWPQIDKVTGKLEELLREADGFITAADPKVLELLDNLRVVTRNLNETILLIKSDPSVVLWGTGEEAEATASSARLGASDDRTFMGPGGEEP